VFVVRNQGLIRTQAIAVAMRLSSSGGDDLDADNVDRFDWCNGSHVSKGIEPASL
jgi:hypothetical protein